MSIAVSLIYSTGARKVVEQHLVLRVGSTVAVALQMGGLHALEGAQHGMWAGQGIWGKKVPLSHVLQDQDRLELYRALTVDPKVARRERFVRQGAKKAAGLFATRRPGAKPGY